MSKKTENIEIRVSPEMKSALAEKSADQGLSMSGYLRDLLERDQAGVADETNSGVPVMAKLLPNPMSRISVAALPVAVLAAVYLLSSNNMAAASAEARMTFAELDLNSDGMITAQEYNAVWGQEMQGIDFTLPAACEGEPIADEFPTSSEEMIREEMAFIDANEDGAISYAELEASVIAERVDLFLMADGNGDGFVTEAEILAEVQRSEQDEYDDLSAACQQALEEMDEQWITVLDEEGNELPDADFDMDEAQMAKMILAAFDGNRDGKISLQEAISQ